MNIQAQLLLCSAETYNTRCVT